MMVLPCFSAARSLLLATAATLLLLVLLPSAVAASGCDPATACTPATPVPPDRWGSLEPRSILSDWTTFRFQFEPGCSVPIYHDVDAEGGKLFAVTGSTFQVWDLTLDPDSPVAPGEICRPVLGPWKRTDQDFYITSVDAPPGRDDMVIAGVEGSMGIVIFDTSNGTFPVLRYQDEGRIGIGSGEIINPKDVHATTLQAVGPGGGPLTTRHFGLAVSRSQSIYAYDLAKARDLSSSCREGSQAGEFSCPGVYVGQVRSGGLPVQSLNMLGGSGQYIVTSNGGTARVWDITNPNDAVEVASGGPNPATVAMWKTGGSLYYGVGTGQEVHVYRVGCLATSSCPAPATLVTVLDTPGGLNSAGFPTPTNRLKTSVDNGTPYLIAGTNSVKGTGPQREYIFDVTDPAVPKEITPKHHPDGYWGWYYEDNVTGFYTLAPYSATVRNSRIYRAAWSVLDVHEILGNLPPVAAIGLPAGTTYGGDNVLLEDLSSRNPTSWTWWFDYANDQTPDSTQQHPTWLLPDAGPYPRTYQVRLEACNENGCDATTEDLVVLDPRPVVPSVATNVASVPQCGTVTFTPQDVTGKDPLAYAWTVRDSGNQNLPGVTGSGPTFAWTVPASQQAGEYRGRVAISNTFGSQSRNSAPFTVTALQQLTTPTIAVDPPDFGEVTFHAGGQGATMWSWDYGDGNTFVSSDPVLGPNPTHNYDSVGTYTVSLTVENCRDGQLSTSTTATITEVAQVEILSFAVNSPACSQFSCVFPVNTPVPFRIQLRGEPQAVTVDFDGDGAFESTLTVPPPSAAGVATILPSFTFTSTGSYTPRVRATRGSQVVERTTAFAVTINQGGGGPPPGPPPAPTPTVLIAGPTSAAVDQAVSFSATASNCGTVTGWTWDLDGGDPSGPTTGGTMVVSWATTGLKTVRATPATGTCTSKSATRNINITEEDPGGGGELDADFVLDVPAPSVGQSVSFDASMSTGTIDEYFWDFGDGKKRGPDKDLAQVKHTYAAEGSYVVRLEITRNDPDCLFGVCVSRKSMTVEVQGELEGTCVASDTTMCLRGGRFALTIDWEKPDGDVGSGQVVPTGTNDSGMFWFFQPHNWEMLVKVLNGCSGPTNHYWVFAASTTNVGFTLTVTDTLTGEFATFVNEVGVAAPAITATKALDVCHAG